jgi:hypothetical protein
MNLAVMEAQLIMSPLPHLMILRCYRQLPEMAWDYFRCHSLQDRCAWNCLLPISRQEGDTYLIFWFEGNLAIVSALF